MNNAAKAALERFRAARTQRDRDQAYSDYGCALRGDPPPRHAFDAMPGRGSRSPKYGRDGRRARDDDFELELRRLLDEYGMSSRELADFLEEHGLSSSPDLGEDTPPEFSGMPNVGAGQGKTRVDPNLTAREGVRQRERDYTTGPITALDELFPDARRIGSAAELHKSRPRASYETKSSLDVFLGRAGARIRNLG